MQGQGNRGKQSKGRRGDREGRRGDRKAEGRGRGQGEEEGVKETGGMKTHRFQVQA
jgi:hypothetical protein